MITGMIIPPATKTSTIIYIEVLTASNQETVKQALMNPDAREISITPDDTEKGSPFAATARKSPITEHISIRTVVMDIASVELFTAKDDCLPQYAFTRPAHNANAKNRYPILVYPDA